MAGPPKFEELREELAQTQLLLEAAHAEIKRQGDIIEALNALGPAPSAEQIAALTPARVAARKESETQAA